MRPRNRLKKDDKTNTPFFSSVTRVINLFFLTTSCLNFKHNWRKRILFFISYLKTVQVLLHLHRSIFVSYVFILKNFTFLITNIVWALYIHFRTLVHRQLGISQFWFWYNAVFSTLRHLFSSCTANTARCVVLKRLSPEWNAFHSGRSFWCCFLWYLFAM